MRKLVLLSGVLLVTVLALAGGLANPDAAWGICFCASNDDFRTPDDWAQGSDCAAATANLTAKLNGHAQADCGAPLQTCLGNIVIFTQCWQVSPGVIQTDGYRFYSCKTCEDPTDPPREV